MPEGNLVKIPFGDHEDLHKMHPDRLLEELRKANCVQAVTTSTSKYVQEVDAVKKTVLGHLAAAKASPGGPRVHKDSGIQLG